jgi:adenylate cyclase
VTGPASPDAVRRLAHVVGEAGFDLARLEPTPESAERLARAVARHLTFSGRRDRTPAEVWEEADVDERLARALWRAMGFPEVPDDTPAFTEADVHALATAAAVFRHAGIGVDVALQQTRAMSQATMRIAAALQDVIALPGAGAEPVASALAAMQLADEVLPSLDGLLVYLFRRHLAAATEQRLAETSRSGDAVTATVGFADMVGFTEATAVMPVEDLAVMVERFNAASAGVVVDAGAKVVKMLGDEVMFAAPSATAGVSAGIALLEEVSATGGVPTLRVAIASGEVLPREGDLFGTTVNLASRLVATARPGTLLVDAATRHGISGNDVRLTPLAPRQMKGLGSVRSWRVRPPSR